MKARIVEERNASAPLLFPPFIRDSGYHAIAAPQARPGARPRPAAAGASPRGGGERLSLKRSDGANWGIVSKPGGRLNKGVFTTPAPCIVLSSWMLPCCASVA